MILTPTQIKIIRTAISHFLDDEQLQAGERVDTKLAVDLAHLRTALRTFEKLDPRKSVALCPSDLLRELLSTAEKVKDRCLEPTP